MNQPRGVCKRIFPRRSASFAMRPGERKIGPRSLARVEGRPRARYNAAMKTTPQDILDALRAQGFAAVTREHAAVFTVAESRAVKDAIPGGHTKNLFLKDKKGRLFLVTAEAEARVDLKRLHETIGASGRLSFCSAEQLRGTLGVEPGSVTPLALVNDREGRVSFVLDARLAAGAVINVHPLVNTMTTSLATADLVAFLAAHGHGTRVLALPEPAPETGETREPIPS